MNICLFTQQEINNPLEPRDERALHLWKILHKKTGDSFAAGITGGQAGTAVITDMVPVPNPKTGKEEYRIFFDFHPESDGKPLNPLVMIIGFPRPIQLKRLLRDIAGLGVKEIHLTGTELGEKSYMQSTLVEKGSAYQMLLDGTVQAASTHVPQLFLHKTLPECLGSINKNDTKIILDNVQPKSSLQNFLNAVKPQSVVAAIGSERGWTDKERALLESEGFTACSMGSRILRTETAATVAGAVILNALGVLD